MTANTSEASLIIEAKHFLCLGSSRLFFQMADHYESVVKIRILVIFAWVHVLLSGTEGILTLASVLLL